MPPRYTYWTIILDGQPTAFRAADRETLLPTLKQLQSKNPDAVLKWFAHGKVWDSPEEARARQGQRGGGRGGRLQPDARREDANPAEAGFRGRHGSERDHRDKGWRPGGEHRDPREKFKKETFQARKRREKKAAALARQGGVAAAPKRDWNQGAKTGGWRKPQGGFDRGPGGGRKPHGGFDRGAEKRRATLRASPPGGPQATDGGSAEAAKPRRPSGPPAKRPWDKRGPKPQGDRRPWDSRPRDGGGRKPQGEFNRGPGGGGRKPEGGFDRRGERRRPDQVRNQEERRPTPPETPRPVVTEPTRPPEPARQAPPYEEERRPSQPGPPSESIRRPPAPPEQGAPSDPGTPAPPHKTKLPRLRKR